MGGTLLVWPEGVGAVKIGCEFFISWSLVSLKVGLQFHYSEVLSVHELKPNHVPLSQYRVWLCICTQTIFQDWTKMAKY